MNLIALNNKVYYLKILNKKNLLQQKLKQQDAKFHLFNFQRFKILIISTVDMMTNLTKW